MSDINQAWVLTETPEALAQLSYAGRTVGKEVTALVFGSNEEAKKAISLGADKVYWLGELGPEDIFENHTDSIIELVIKEKPGIVLIESTRRGKLLAGRIAAAIGTSAVIDVNELRVNEGAIQTSRMVYGGAAFRKEKLLSTTALATANAGIFEAFPEDAARQGVISPIDFVETGSKLKVLEKKKKEGSTINITAAKRVIGVGRGIAAEEDLDMVTRFAECIDAEVGCSRSIAESNKWLPKERYIGVSGVMLKPDVYLAVGISGQVQHMVGVNQARIIISINKDKAAPIFQKTDYGVVGDLYKVVPRLLEKFQQ